MAAAPIRCGFVVALPAEARAVAGGRWQRQDGWPVKRCRQDGCEQIWVRCGIGPQRAAAATRWLAAQGVSALAVLGVSGGIDPALAPGDLVLATAVIDGCDESRPLRLEVQARWYEQPLLGAGLAVRCGTILTASRPVLQPMHKAELFRRHGALAVDMESAAVARVAAEMAIPCTVLRSICDPAQRPVAEDVFGLVDERGRVSFTALLTGLLKRPGLVIDLLRMQRDFGPSLKALEHGSRVLTACLTANR